MNYHNMFPDFHDFDPDSLFPTDDNSEMMLLESPLHDSPMALHPPHPLRSSFATIPTSRNAVAMTRFIGNFSDGPYLAGHYGERLMDESILTPPAGPSKHVQSLVSPPISSGYRQASPDETLMTGSDDTINSSIPDSFGGCGPYCSNGNASPYDLHGEMSFSPDLSCFEHFPLSKGPTAALSAIQRFSEDIDRPHSRTYRPTPLFESLESHQESSDLWPDFQIPHPGGATDVDPIAEADTLDELKMDLAFDDSDASDCESRIIVLKRQHRASDGSKQQHFSEPPNKRVKLTTTDPQQKTPKAPKMQSGATTVDRPGKGKVSAPSLSARPFPCALRPYGCHQTFTSKNEWKRHTSKQHLRLEVFRCDLCPDAGTRPNDFIRKDLFTAHLKRMHSGTAESPRPGNAKPEKSSNGPNRKRSQSADNSYDSALRSEEICKRCFIKVREAPTKMQCVFCNQHFHGVEASERWLDHIAGHLAKNKRDAWPKSQKEGDDVSRYDVDWARDGLLRTWLLQEGIIEPWRGGFILVDKDKARALDGVKVRSSRSGRKRYDDDDDDDAEGDVD